MTTEKKMIHDLNNQLAISIGHTELLVKAISKEGLNIDLNKVKERLEKSLAAQVKAQEILASTINNLPISSRE